MRLSWSITAVGIVAVAGWLTSLIGYAAHEEHARCAVPTESLPADGVVRSNRAVSIELPAIDSRQAYALTVSLDAPELLDVAGRLPVRVARGGAAVVEKFLHDGDPDLFVLVRGAGEPGATLQIGDADSPVQIPFQAVVRMVSQTPRQHGSGNHANRYAIVETEPNDRPEDATEFELGQTVFASADDRAYIAAEGVDDEAAKTAGEDWYKFTATDSEPRLAFISLDFIDREVPADLAIFTMSEGKPELYQADFEKFEPEKTTRFAGMFKFVARRVEPGATYYLRVRANHPAYQIRSETWPIPPYDPATQGGVRGAAETAVRTAMDYLLLKGDSWHANTPRVGGIDNRLHNVHAETAQCIACHPTHFTTRAAVFANENGYPIRQRPSLQFLTERLYNNPRPFYGHPQAAWSRMISASANVLSRLSIMLNLFEHNIAGSERTEVHQAVAEYLKLYYKDRQEIPANETNGNQPLVSKFEVAEYSWMVFAELQRRTGDAEYARWAGHVQMLIESADPAKHIQDMADLCYQTSAFCRIDSNGYADRIRANVERIFSYQRADGQWPMRFGDKEPVADFQTGHCLYTLALAGISADDPRMDRAIRYLLSRQQSFGGWFDHDDNKTTYENFRTPFYESQFAVMALSQLFPCSPAANAHGEHLGGSRTWHAGFQAPPAEINESDWQTLIAELDMIWERPGARALTQIAGALEHDNPLVREVAANCLGRVGDESSVDCLIAALADRSKLVRRAAAASLRSLGNRGFGKQAVTAALHSDNSTVRRGALRVFAQHFRYWMDAGEARQTILERLMADRDPYIRMMACRALWQWWYWDADESVRGAIEDAFLGRMASEEHPWVRINLIEGFANICDENTRYLYNNWIALLGTKTDRDQATAGHHASGTRQATKIAAALDAGDDRQIDAVLQAIGYFHLRTGTYAAKGRFGRIGNDVEGIQFYSEVAPVLKRSLAPLIASDRPELRGPALLAAYTLRGTGSEDVLGLAFLNGLADRDDFTRGVATEFYSSFLPPLDEETEPAVLGTLARLLDSEFPEARRSALELVGKLNFSPNARTEVAQSVARYLAGDNEDQLPQALQAAASLPAIWKDPALIKRLAAAIQSKNKEQRQAATRLALLSDTIGGATLIRTRLDGAFGSKESATRKSLLELGQANEPLLKHPRIAQLVSDSLTDDESSVRQLALDLVRRSRDLKSNASVRASLAELTKDPNERTRQIAESLYSGKGLAPADVDVAKLLDFEFFKQKVQPIFLAPGPDQKACVQCHHNHGILKLTPPPEDGPVTDEIARENYRSALRVVNLAEPEKSLILQKPLGSADAEGIVGTTTIPHGGELRWPDRSSSQEFRTILAWINGARVEAPSPGVK